MYEKRWYKDHIHIPLKLFYLNKALSLSFDSFGRFILYYQKKIFGIGCCIVNYFAILLFYYCVQSH
jgi:hypothetical protein